MMVDKAKSPLEEMDDLYEETKLNMLLKEINENENIPDSIINEQI
jgi:hypothetical protein